MSAQLPKTHTHAISLKSERSHSQGTLAEVGDSNRKYKYGGETLRTKQIRCFIFCLVSIRIDFLFFF